MKVSILIPCYNVEEFLPQCLDSVVNQTYRDLQIVLVDDGSIDSTLDIAKRYAALDSRIEVYHQENQGVATARNILLSKISGDYFLFVDSDDWMELNMVDFLVSRATREMTDMVACGRVLNDDIPSLSFTENKWDKEKVVKEFLRHIDFNGSLWNKLFSVSLLSDHPTFHPMVSYGEDALFCWELIKVLNTAFITDCQLYHHRINANGLSCAKWTPSKKGTGHIVWQKIVYDVEMNRPQYLDIAKARFAIEDMWGLYFAALGNYPNDEHIHELQQNIRNNFSLVRKSGYISKDKLAFSWIISRWYGFGRILSFIRKQSIET